MCAFLVWVTQCEPVKISDIHTSHTSGWLRCKGWCMYMCRPCVTRKKDPVEWQVISLNPPPRTTQSAPARACLVSVTMSRCWCHWAYRNWSVECLIDQTRQPLRWLSVRRSFSQSLSLWGPYLCCVFLLWLSVSLTKKELFLLKLTALNFRDKLAMTYMWQTLCFSQGCRV